MFNSYKSNYVLEIPIKQNESTDKITKSKHTSSLEWKTNGEIHPEQFQTDRDMDISPLSLLIRNNPGVKRVKKRAEICELWPRPFV